jgi:regulator of protease activity HflC (stomatin/prohibitin superfamily)
MGGISSILGALALLGFLAFLGGIGLVVVAASQGRNVRGGITLAIAGLVVGLLFSVISQGILIVSPQEVAVVFNTLSGELENPPRRAGTSVVIPVLQEAVIYPIEQQEYTMASLSGEGAGGNAEDDALEGRSVDGQVVIMDLTVIYNIMPEQANLVHERWRNRYEEQFIRPTIRGVARDVISQFRAEDIFGTRRTEVGAAVEEAMRARMEAEGLNLSNMIIRNVSFSDDFADAIERREIAEQERLRALDEAERLRVQAAGTRDAEITSAEGEAQAIILRAQAQAEALRLVSEQLAANPTLIQYEYVQRLSDNIQLALVPANSPFLFDFNSLAEANPDFVAPTVPEAEVPEAEADPADSGG